MQKSSFIIGLLNSEEKNIAEYLATWDDLNVFFKTLDKSWDFAMKASYPNKLDLTKSVYASE